jgi:adenylate kinase family enzyme
MSLSVIIRGPLGAGKTTISKRLADILGATYISIDMILDSLPEDWDEEGGCYSEKSFLHVNEIAAAQAKEALCKDEPVVFDGNFYWPSQIEDLPRRLHGPVIIFTLRVPLATCIERDGLRNPPHGEQAARDVFALTTSFTAGIEIDATGSVESVVATIVSQLPSKGSPR